MRFWLPLLLLSTPAWGFHAYPKGGPHDRVTRRAAEAGEMSNGAVSALKRGVRQVDLAEIAMDLRAAGNARLLRGPAAEALLQPRCTFDGAHHLQRTKDLPVDAVLRQARGVIKQSRIQTLSALEDGDEDKALEAMALGLHVIQDFFAHTNFVELDEKAREVLYEWLLGRGDLPPVLDLKLIVYQPCGGAAPREGELRTSLDEAAASCSEDETSAFCLSVASPRSVAGSRKDALGNRSFDRAVGYATDASIEWVLSLQRLAGDNWAVLQ